MSQLFLAVQGWTVNNAFHDLMGTANLVFQFVILGVLLTGVWLRKSRGVDLHGNIILAALLMGVFSTMLAMIPSLFDIWVTQRWLYPLILLHGAVGMLTLSSGVWVVAAWALNDSDPKYCFRRKGQMKLVLYVWVASVGIGISVYVMHILYGF